MTKYKCQESTWFKKLENDLLTLKTAREESHQILKCKPSKKSDRHSRLKTVQKEKSKLASFEKVKKVHQSLAKLPKITLFYDISRSRSKLADLVTQRGRIEKKLMDFWMYWPKDIFTNCGINNHDTEKASNIFKDDLSAYARVGIYCELLESQFYIIENLLKATVLRVGKKKASLSVFEKIYDGLSGEKEFRKTLLMKRMTNKKRICDRLKKFESSIKAGEVVSFN